MNRHYAFAIAPLSLGLALAAPARAQSLQMIERSAWDGGVSLPSYVEMHVYVPNGLTTSPAIVVSAHSCGGSASNQLNAMDYFRATTDTTGDIVLIFPDNPGQNCWDVGSNASLTHDGGGDTHAVAQMVRYALSTYNGDPDRVYVCGGSSGGMMTQAMVGVYPEMFQAGAARAGVPCGCWAENYDPSNQWSGPCAGGTVSKTAQEWGDYVRAINSDYSGHRPRVMLFHGDADPTINYNNQLEAIKEWTNVLGLTETPTSEDSITTSIASYNRQFWVNDCGVTALEAWTAPGRDHSMDYEEEAWLEFFGLDVVGGPDPEANCSGTGGTGGTGGAGGAGGDTGGTGGATGGGGVDTGGSPTGGVPSTGGEIATGGVGAVGTGGESPTGGSDATGGVATGGASPTGGAIGSGGVGTGGVATGGVSPTGGMAVTGGMAAVGGTVATGGAGGLGATSPTPGAEEASDSEGCSCRLGSRRGGSASLTALLVAMLGLVVRRRRANGKAGVQPRSQR